MSHPAWIMGAVLVGHVGLLVWMVNVAHGLGLRGRWLDRATLGVLAAIPALGVWMLGTLGDRPWSAWPLGLRLYAVPCLAVATVGLPVSLLRRWTRKPPEGVSGRTDPVDLADRHGPDALIGHGWHAWLLRLPANEALRLNRNHWEVAWPSWPEALDGWTLVQISDLHCAPWYNRRFFEAALDELADWDADLIAVTGDLVDHDDAIAWLAPLLSRLQARCGVFAILGNHDYQHDTARIRREVRRAGLTDLDGRWTRLDLDTGATLALGGTSAPWGPALDPSAMPPADARVLLSHSPDLFPQAARWGIDLMLAGHSHGGQVRVPGLGPIFLPSRFGRQFDRGFFQQGRTVMYVSQGLGAKHPIRYNCPPEITRLVLRSAVARDRDPGAPAGRLAGVALRNPNPS